MSESNAAYLSLGSNIAPEHNLRQAVLRLVQYGKVRAVSSAWESPPVDGSDQPNYLNAAVLLETDLSARELREVAIPRIEAALGRRRSANRYAARTIDIDLVLFNNEVLQLGDWIIPDPEILERPYVAIPLAEISPDTVHPATGETLKAIAARFDPLAAGMRRREDVW